MQPELRRILYPVFIHTFLDLMQKGSTAEAMQLMNRFKRRFREDAAFPSKIRKQVDIKHPPPSPGGFRSLDWQSFIPLQLHLFPLTAHLVRPWHAFSGYIKHPRHHLPSAHGICRVSLTGRLNCIAHARIRVTDLCSTKALQASTRAKALLISTQLVLL